MSKIVVAMVTPKIRYINSYLYIKLLKRGRCKKTPEGLIFREKSPSYTTIQQRYFLETTVDQKADEG